MSSIDVKFKVLEDRRFVIRHDDSVTLSMYILALFEVGRVVELVGCCFSKDQARGMGCLMFFSKKSPAATGGLEKSSLLLCMRM